MIRRTTTFPDFSNRSTRVTEIDPDDEWGSVELDCTLRAMFEWKNITGARSVKKVVVHYTDGGADTFDEERAPLPAPAEIVDLRCAAQEDYRTARDRIAALVLLELALAARDTWPGKARFIGLTTSDQNADGEQWITAVLADDGRFLSTEGAELEEVETSDLYDGNRHVWEPFLVPDDVTSAWADLGAERYLDVEQILAAHVDLRNG